MTVLEEKSRDEMIQWIIITIKNISGLDLSAYSY